MSIAAIVVAGICNENRAVAEYSYDILFRLEEYIGFIWCEVPHILCLIWISMCKWSNLMEVSCS